MTWDTVNVLTIPWAGEIAGKLAGKILDVLEMYWVGTCWVHYPFPCNVLAMYWLRTPPLAPSAKTLLCPGSGRLKHHKWEKFCDLYLRDMVFTRKIVGRKAVSNIKLTP